eukprot:10415035-Prorocentrum_lima.AAC.1
MTSSLVGSEMCIRDRCKTWQVMLRPHPTNSSALPVRGVLAGPTPAPSPCLLYTSDAADDM